MKSSQARSTPEIIEATRRGCLLLSRPKFKTEKGKFGEAKYVQYWLGKPVKLQDSNHSMYAGATTKTIHTAELINTM